MIVIIIKLVSFTHYLIIIVYNNYISKVKRTFRACDRHSVETVTLDKYVAEYEQLRKWMAEFLATFMDIAQKFPELIRFTLPNHWFYSIILFPPPCGLGVQNSVNVCPCACCKRRLTKGYKLSHTTGLLHAWHSCMQ